MEAVAPVAAAGPPVLSRSRHHLSFNAPLTLTTCHSLLPTYDSHSSTTTEHISLPTYFPLITASSYQLIATLFQYSLITVHFLSHIIDASQLYVSNYLLQTLFSWTHNLLHTIVHRHNLSPTIFDTPFFTHTFVTLYVSPTSLSHITFDTSLSHSFVTDHLTDTIFQTHHILHGKHPCRIVTHYLCPTPIVFPPKHFWLIIGGSWVVGLSGRLYVCMFFFDSCPQIPFRMALWPFQNTKIIFFFKFIWWFGKNAFQFFPSQYFLFSHDIYQLGHPTKNAGSVTEPATSGHLTVAAWSMRCAKCTQYDRSNVGACHGWYKIFPEKMAKLFSLLYKTIFDIFQNSLEKFHACHTNGYNEKFKISKIHPSTELTI